MYTYTITIALVVLSALFSGLTLGLMGLNAQELKRKASLGDVNAKKIYSVRKRGNFLLTTLLVGNVAVNSTLAIFLGSIATGVIAGLVATGLIVIFGEIIPQAIFSRFALQFGAKFVWLVKLFFLLLFPVVLPIAWVLDKALGEEIPAIYSKRELIKIIEEHEDSPDSDLKEDEERIIKGALTFSYKKVREVMTPRIATVSIEASQVLDKKLIQHIADSAYSRFPVYEEDMDKIIGVLYLKDLLGSENYGKKAKEVADKEVLFVDDDRNLGYVFSAFLKTHKHLFVVINEFGSFVGVVTMEDILEEIIRSEIMDERDKHRDMRKYAKSKAPKRQNIV